MNFSFWEKRTRWTPTWLGWLLILLLMSATATALLFNVHPFLALNTPSNEGLLVIEGWLPDYAIDEAIEIYRSGTYEKIVSTGILFDTGTNLIKWKSYSQMTTDRLIARGIDPSTIITAVGNNVRRDRTYAMAMAVKKQLIAAGISQTNIHLISLGPHGRRSHLIYSNVLGKDYNVGITSLEDQCYDADQWWISSNGFRNLIDELIAYIYVKLVFNPSGH